MKQFTDEQIEKVQDSLVESLKILSASDNIERFLEMVNKNQINVEMLTDESKDVWNSLIDSFPGSGERV